MGVAMEQHRGLPIVPFARLADWETWLECNHETAAGLWLKLAKKGSDDRERDLCGGA